MADPIRRNLEQVFRQGDAPADKGCNPPGFVGQIAQVCVPGKSHENVRQHQ
jgi:hypothetical protein